MSVSLDKRPELLPAFCLGKFPLPRASPLKTGSFLSIIKRAIWLKGSDIIMKKLLAVLLSATFLAISAAGCSSQSSASSSSASSETSSDQSIEVVSSESAAEPADSEKLTIRVGAFKGPTAMGMVKLMEDSESGEAANNYTFSIMGSVDEVTPKLLQGELDIAALPANLASVLYNNSNAEIQVTNINTLGVLYIVETGDTIHSVADLKGKTIYASGKGATPEYALNYLLVQNGLDPASDVTIEWKSEHTECVAALAQSENGIAMLPQPFVTTAQAQNANIRVALDMTQEWEALQANTEHPSALLTGVTVVRTEFAKEHPEEVAAFLEEYQASTEYVNANIPEASALIEKYDIVPAAVAEKALPQCNIVYIDGDQMKDQLGGYLAVLMEQNPKSIGGALPGEDFYYSTPE